MRSEDLNNHNFDDIKTALVKVTEKATELDVMFDCEIGRQFLYTDAVETKRCYPNVVIKQMSSPDYQSERKILSDVIELSSELAFGVMLSEQVDLQNPVDYLEDQGFQFLGQNGNFAAFKTAPGFTLKFTEQQKFKQLFQLATDRSKIVN